MRDSADGFVKAMLLSSEKEAKLIEGVDENDALGK
jgi:hypothetical protein